MTENNSNPKPIDEALAKARTYTFGQSREPLSFIEREVIAFLADQTQRAELAQQFGDYLDSEATPDSKNFICKQMAILNQDTAIESILKLLGQSDTADQALFALERIDHPSVVHGLREALKTISGKALLGILLVLGRKKDTVSVPAISKYADHTSLDYSEAAIRALGMIGSAASYETLKKVDYSRSPQIHRAWGNSLLQIAEGFQAAGDTAAAAEIFQKLQAKDHPFGTRKAALLGLVGCGEKYSQAALEEALNDPDGKLKQTAQRIRNTSH